MELLKFDKENKVKSSLSEMKRNLPDILEYSIIIAKIRKANYDAYIKEGFTKQQALELCSK